MYPYPTPNYQVPQVPTFNPVNQNIPEIQYVNSAESADAFNLPPNKTAVLFNQNSDEFYILSADASGSKTRRDFTFKAKEVSKPSEYVTKAEFDEFKNRCEEIINSVSKAPKKTAQKATEVEE